MLNPYFNRTRWQPQIVHSKHYLSLLKQSSTKRFSARNEGFYINLLMRNVNCSGRTAPLTSEVAFYIFIQQI